jgi:spore coat protein U-like protein
MKTKSSTSRILSALAVSAGFLALGTFAPVAALAGASTAPLTVSASVAQNCTIGAGTLSFGAYDPVVANRTAAATASGTMVVTCTKGSSGVTVGFANSANAPTGCTAPQRCLASGSSYLNYNIYPTISYTAAWTTALAETVSGGITTPTSLTIYGQIPGGQDVATGASYADSVVASVNF